MRPHPRPLAGTRLAAQLLALLLALSLAWLLGGCGDDGDPSSSSSDESSESSEPSETESESASESDSDSESAEPDPVDAELQTFIAGCKQGVDQQISAGKVPESLRDDLEAVCDSATGVDQEDVDRITLETCVVVASGTSNLSEDEARTRCEAQLS
jgi:hypothetical protein